jgi:hypothetical protein
MKSGYVYVHDIGYCTIDTWELYDGIDISDNPRHHLLYIGETGVDLVNEYGLLPKNVDGMLASIIADYLEDRVYSSEWRDVAVRFYRRVASDPNRNQWCGFVV